ncbi:MAG TPA: hypothetical protein VH797_06880 [Nitrososphaeraceae archaeon]
MISINRLKPPKKVLSKIVVIFLSSAWIAQLFGAGKYAFAILTDISVQIFLLYVDP